MSLMREGSKLVSAVEKATRSTFFTPGAAAGRLDIDSTGLLVLTQDGRVARLLIGDDSKVEKEYLVRVEGALDARSLALLNHGLELDGKKLRPAITAPGGIRHEFRSRFPRRKPPVARVRSGIRPEARHW